MTLIGHTAPLPASLSGAHIDPARLPYVAECPGRTTLLQEPGRVLVDLDGFTVNLTAHAYAITRVGQHNPMYRLHAKNGAGERDFHLPLNEAAMAALLAMPSDLRFAMLHGIASVQRSARQEGEAATLDLFKADRLRKVRRKAHGRSWTEVDILPETGVAA